MRYSDKTYNSCENLYAVAQIGDINIIYILLYIILRD